MSLVNRKLRVRYDSEYGISSIDPPCACPEPLKILLQHPHKAGDISGVVTFVEIATRALRSSGHEVKILPTAEVSRREALAALRWADVIHLNSTHPLLTVHSRLRGKRLINSLHFPLWGTWKATPQHRALGFLGCLSKTIGVFWGHGKGWRHTKNFAGYFSTSVLRMFVRLACVLLAHRRIAPTRFIADDAVLPCRIDVIPYPFDCDEVQELRIVDLERAPKFCYVGRITAEKGPDLLVEAAHLLSLRKVEATVSLVGDGSQLVPLRRRAEELGLGERFQALGKLPRQEALREMASSLAVVIPSRWDDPSPFTVLEGCALGRPVIGSDRGGIPEIAGPGLIFASDSASDLADRMEQLVTQPEEAERIGADCLAFIRERSAPDRIVEMLLQLYRTN